MDTTTVAQQTAKWLDVAAQTHVACRQVCDLTPTHSVNPGGQRQVT